MPRIAAKVNHGYFPTRFWDLRESLLCGRCPAAAKIIVSPQLMYGTANRLHPHAFVWHGGKRVQPAFLAVFGAALDKRAHFRSMEGGLRGIDAPARRPKP